jgi:hypothetical protein
MIVLVFDINSKESFKSCTKWYKDAAAPTPNHHIPGNSAMISNAFNIQMSA